jgi:hypothetical protein
MDRRRDDVPRFLSPQARILFKTARLGGRGLGRGKTGVGLAQNFSIEARYQRPSALGANIQT